jgi:hypothetical protein
MTNERVVWLSKIGSELFDIMSENNVSKKEAYAMFNALAIWYVDEVTDPSYASLVSEELYKMIINKLS